MSSWDGAGPKHLSLQIICGIVCVLSLVGSLAIVVTFVLLKEIRSKARELLVHVSVMDITYTTANFVGMMVPYRGHMHDNSTTSNSSEDYESICKAQAFFAIYGTVGSVLWTLALAVYLYYKIVSRDDNVTRRLVRILYIVCYALPLYVSLWLLLDHHMGYPHNVLSGAGWCSIRDDTHELVVLMTYDIWIWLGIIILIPLYLVIHVHIREQVKITRDNQNHDEYWTTDQLAAVTKAERKLLLIPLVFLFLRIWDIIGVFLFVYIKNDDNNSSHYYWLQLLTTIGDNGQGFVNFIIFFLFQPTLRRFMIMNICRYCCCCCKRYPGRHMQFDSTVDDDDDGRNSDIDTPSRTPEHFSQTTLYK